MERPESAVAYNPAATPEHGLVDQSGGNPCTAGVCSNGTSARQMWTTGLLVWTASKHMIHWSALWCSPDTPSHPSLTHQIGHRWRWTGDATDNIPLWTGSWDLWSQTSLSSTFAQIPHFVMKHYASMAQCIHQDACCIHGQIWCQFLITFCGQLADTEQTYKTLCQIRLLAAHITFLNDALVNKIQYFTQKLAIGAYSSGQISERTHIVTRNLS